jgi:hypothetical protein
VALAWWAVPLLGVGFGVARYLRSGARWREIERRREYIERGVRRVTAARQGEGRTGEEFAREEHLYQSDLNVIGEGSLFELLCTTRSEFGAERLAEYLLEPVSLEESRRRQDAVRKLREGACYLLCQIRHLVVMTQSIRHEGFLHRIMGPGRSLRRLRNGVSRVQIFVHSGRSFPSPRRKSAVYCMFIEWHETCFKDWQHFLTYRTARL